MPKSSPERPRRGDFITLDSPAEHGRVAVVVGFSPSGDLRIRRARPFNRYRDHIRTYRGPWSALPLSSRDHPAWIPTTPADFEDLES